MNHIFGIRQYKKNSNNNQDWGLRVMNFTLIRKCHNNTTNETIQNLIQNYKKPLIFHKLQANWRMWPLMYIVGQSVGNK